MIFDHKMIKFSARKVCIQPQQPVSDVGKIASKTSRVHLRLYRVCTEFQNTFNQSVSSVHTLSLQCLESGPPVQARKVISDQCSE